jgi:hypothetical protein
VWLKGGNHAVKDAFSKAFIKRSVSLQPSEEQGSRKRVDQQLWIRRRLQFAGHNSVFDDSALDLTIARGARQESVGLSQFGVPCDAEVGEKGAP